MGVWVPKGELGSGRMLTTRCFGQSNLPVRQTGDHTQIRQRDSRASWGSVQGEHDDAISSSYQLAPQVMNVFWDHEGPLIAFNRGGAIFCNA